MFAKSEQSKTRRKKRNQKKDTIQQKLLPYAPNIFVHFLLLSLYFVQVFRIHWCISVLCYINHFYCEHAQCTFCQCQNQKKCFFFFTKSKANFIFLWSQSYADNILTNRLTLFSICLSIFCQLITYAGMQDEQSNRKRSINQVAAIFVCTPFDCIDIFLFFFFSLFCFLCFCGESKQAKARKKRTNTFMKNHKRNFRRLCRSKGSCFGFLNSLMTIDDASGYRRSAAWKHKKKELKSEME